MTTKTAASRNAGTIKTECCKDVLRATEEPKAHPDGKNATTGQETAFPAILEEFFDALLDVATDPLSELAKFPAHVVVADYMSHVDVSGIGVDPAAFRTRAVEEIEDYRESLRQ